MMKKNIFTFSFLVLLSILLVGCSFFESNSSQKEDEKIFKGVLNDKVEIQYYDLQEKTNMKSTISNQDLYLDAEWKIDTKLFTSLKFKTLKNEYHFFKNLDFKLIPYGNYGSLYVKQQIYIDGKPIEEFYNENFLVERIIETFHYSREDKIKFNTIELRFVYCNSSFEELLSPIDYFREQTMENNVLHGLSFKNFNINVEKSLIQ